MGASTSVRQTKFSASQNQKLRTYRVGKERIFRSMDSDGNSVESDFCNGIRCLQCLQCCASTAVVGLELSQCDAAVRDSASDAHANLNATLNSATNLNCQHTANCQLNWALCCKYPTILHPSHLHRQALAFSVSILSEQYLND
jgi:hypothetical protein